MRKKESRNLENHLLREKEENNTWLCWNQECLVVTTFFRPAPQTKLSSSSGKGQPSLTDNERKEKRKDLLGEKYKKILLNCVGKRLAISFFRREKLSGLPKRELQ